MQPVDYPYPIACNCDDYILYVGQLAPATEETPSTARELPFLETSSDNKLPSIKYYEEDEWQPSKSSEPMEDIQRPPRLPESLDYLRDWRNYTATEPRWMGNRMSMGSSTGEQRLSLTDSFSAWANIDAISTCEKLQLEPFDLPTARPNNSQTVQTSEEIKRSESFGLCLFDKVIHEPEDRSTEMSSKGDSARSPEKGLLDRKEDIVVSEEEVEESPKKEFIEVSRDDENDPNLANANPKVIGPGKVSHGSGKKKCCNCKKSRCLKLYCECFASQGYCSGCKCVDCHNIAEYAEEKKAAVSRVNTKNPYGFLRRLPTNPEEAIVGCNCKRSGCQRNYCCCYKKGGQCSSICKCTQCKNGKESDENDNENSPPSPGLNSPTV